MKITSLTLYKVKPRWVFLKIETDEGISGWGEPIVESRAETSITAVKELEGFLIGADPSRIEHLFQLMYRGTFYRGGPVLMSAISGVEQALWDIRGKALGLPVYEIMGGVVRDKIKAYAWVGGDDPETSDEDAKVRLEQGFRNIKMNAVGACERIGSYGEIDSAVARLAAVREAVGPDVGIGIDFHGRVHKSMAKTLVKEMEQYRPMFYEEPVLPEHLDFLPELARHTSIPLATGERLYGRWGFKELISQGTIDIIQPDLSHAGGIWETRKIAAMAEAYDIGVAPHCPLGPLALASSMQLDACTPNFVIQEMSIKMQYNTSGDLLDCVKNKDVFDITDGYLSLPKLPGLGIDIDEEAVIENDKEGFAWKPRDWRHEDGSVAEW
ncbi:MAG: galactonate dehydratase [Verrucomicrobia bacterium]|nr:galactonate dehydratase [Verrucomicrobiota bacterium]MDA1068110.1 galactonate dehydratase [Verrucomicrobiota bacterium]